MTDHTGSSYKGYIGIDRKSGDIAHYGKNFANGDRGGHWDIIINGVWPRGGTEHWVVSFKQPTQKGTRWLSANGGGGMGSETENRSDEKFVIMGSTKDCRVQRYDNFTAGPTNDGYLRAHRLGTDRDQADITADGKPNWNINHIKLSLFNPFPSYENGRETIFHLGLFY